MGSEEFKKSSSTESLLNLSSSFIFEHNNIFNCINNLEEYINNNEINLSKETLYYQNLEQLHKELIQKVLQDTNIDNDNNNKNHSVILENILKFEKLYSQLTNDITNLKQIKDINHSIMKQNIKLKTYLLNYNNDNNDNNDKNHKNIVSLIDNDLDYSNIDFIQCLLLKIKQQISHETYIQESINKEIKDIKNILEKNKIIYDKEESILNNSIKTLNNNNINIINDIDILRNELQELQKRRKQKFKAKITLKSLKNTIKKDKIKHKKNIDKLYNDKLVLEDKNKQIVKEYKELQDNIKKKKKYLLDIKSLENKHKKEINIQKEQVNDIKKELNILTNKTKQLKQEKEQLYKNIQSPSFIKNTHLHNILDKKKEESIELEDDYSDILEQYRQLIQHEKDTIIEEEESCNEKLQELIKIQQELQYNDEQNTQNEINEITNHINLMQDRIKQREAEYLEIVRKQELIKSEEKKAKLLIQKNKKRLRKEKRRSKQINSLQILDFEVNSPRADIPPSLEMRTSNTCILNNEYKEEKNEEVEEEEAIIIQDILVNNNNDDEELRSSTGEQWVKIENNHQLSIKRNIISNVSETIDISSRFSALKIPSDNSEDESDKSMLQKRKKKKKRRNINQKQLPKQRNMIISNNNKKKKQDKRKENIIKNALSNILLFSGVFTIIIIFVLIWKNI